MLIHSFGEGKTAAFGVVRELWWNLRGMKPLDQEGHLAASNPENSGQREATEAYKHGTFGPDGALEPMDQMGHLKLSTMTFLVQQRQW